MDLNFDKICRFCMIENDKLFSIFENGANMIQKVMLMISDMQVNDQCVFIRNL
jgi:hypothetical protein